MILDKMKERENTPKRGKGRGSAKSSGTSTPVDVSDDGTRRKRKRRLANNDDDDAIPPLPDRSRTPKRQKQVNERVPATSDVCCMPLDFDVLRQEILQIHTCTYVSNITV